MTKCVLATAIAASVLIMSGCLVNSRSHTSTSGRYISSTTLRHIEPGTSRSDLVIALLGSPTVRTSLDDGTEIWRYEYRKRTRSSGSVFLLLNSANSTERDGAVFVVLRDGVVEKTWRDE
jgi:outer membrane protein assembly factor BamE (lipoprotein component of BamABCDE complex)